MVGDKGEQGGRFEEEGEELDVLAAVGEQVVFLCGPLQKIGTEFTQAPGDLCGREAVFRGFQPPEQRILVQIEKLHHISGWALSSVHPETSNFVRVQGARKTQKRSVHAVREHLATTEQHGNRAKGPFPDGH